MNSKGKLVKKHSQALGMTVAALMGLAAVCSQEASGQAVFTMLSEIDGVQTYVRGMTPDGRFIVGMRGPYGTGEAYRWCAESGVVGLGRLPGAPNSSAGDISADGRVIVGTCAYVVQWIARERAFVWTESEGMSELPRPAEYSRCSAMAVSADGRTIVGTASGEEVGLRPVQWIRQGAGVGLGQGGEWEFMAIPELVDGASPTAMTSDGLQMIANFNLNGRHLRVGGGVVALPVHPEFEFTQAVALSADGNTVVGRADGWCLTPQAMRWHRPSTGCGGEVELLGSLWGGGQSRATGVNRDGTIVVGISEGLSNSGSETAFVWTPEHGMRKLRDFAIAQGVNMSGIGLTTATQISPDGSIVAGTRRVGNTHYGWVITGLQFRCVADADRSGQVDSADVFVFLGDWFANRDSADLNRSGVADVPDMFEFFGFWFAGCP